MTITKIDLHHPLKHSSKNFLLLSSSANPHFSINFPRRKLNFIQPSPSFVPLASQRWRSQVTVINFLWKFFSFSSPFFSTKLIYIHKKLNLMLVEVFPSLGFLSLFFFVLNKHSGRMACPISLLVKFSIGKWHRGTTIVFLSHVKSKGERARYDNFIHWTSALNICHRFVWHLI